MKMTRETVPFSKCRPRGRVFRFAGTLAVISLARAQEEPPPAPAPLSVIVSGPVDVRGSVDLLNDAFRTPFNTNVTGTIAAGSLTSFPAAINIPAGKRLVIETISVRVRVPSGQRVQAELQATAAVGSRATGFECPIGVQFEGIFEREDVFVGTHRVRLVIDRRQVSRLEFSFSRSANFSAGSFTAFLGGYLEDEPVTLN